MKSFFQMREERGAGDQGTNELVNKYKSETPGQGESGEKKQKARKGDMLGNKDEPSKKMDESAEHLENIMEGLPQEKFHSAEAKLVAYAKKNGGVDKRDFMDIAKMCGQIARVNILQAGQVLARLNRKIDGLDTDVRDKVFEIMKSVELMEAVKLDEAKSKAGDALMAYAKKSGGIDKNDMMKIAGKLQNHAATGNPSNVADIAKMLKNMDTDPRDKVIDICMKNDPAMCKSIMRKAGMKLREDVQLDESRGEGYKASSEKSQFGGYRAKLLNPQGKMSYMGGTAWKTAKAAEGEAAAYHKGYFSGPVKNNERGADRLVHAYKQKNAKDLYKKESVEVTEALEVKLRGGKVPVGQHKFKYDVDKSDKYIENSIKSRDKDAKVERKGKDLWVTASAGAHSSVIGSLRQFRVNGTVSESVELDERSPWAELKVKFHKTFNKNYEKALKWMKDTGKSAADAERMFRGTDARELAKMATQMESIEEAAGNFTDKQIKMAYGIINDPRWKSGNMTAIVRKIEGIAKGLSKHPGVQKALRVTNEDVELVIDALIEQQLAGMEMLEESLNEDWDENNMALNQLKFIEYSTEEISEWIEEDMIDMPEWFQNKLSSAFTTMRDLHAYVEGERYEDDEEEMDEYYESTQAYGDAQRKIARDRQQKMMKPGEMDKLRKLRQMLDKEKKNK